MPKPQPPKKRGPRPKPQGEDEPRQKFSVYLSQTDLKKLKLLATVQNTDVAALVNKGVGLLLEKDAELLERALKILDPLSAKD